jgi:glutamate synthase domain-containing protein 3
MEPLDESGTADVHELLREHVAETASRTAEGFLRAFDPERFVRVTTAVAPEGAE